MMRIVAGWFAAPRAIRRPRARSSAGTRRSRTAFCSRTITCPVISKPRSRASSSNHSRYHESLQNLTPADVYIGRAKTILLERERIKRDTIKLRRLHDPPGAQRLDGEERNKDHYGGRQDDQYRVVAGRDPSPAAGNTAPARAPSVLSPGGGPFSRMASRDARRENCVFCPTTPQHSGAGGRPIWGSTGSMRPAHTSRRPALRREGSTASAASDLAVFGAAPQLTTRHGSGRRS